MDETTAEAWLTAGVRTRAPGLVEVQGTGQFHRISPGAFLSSCTAPPRSFWCAAFLPDREACSGRNRARFWCRCPRCAQPQEGGDEAGPDRSRRRFEISVARARSDEGARLHGTGPA